jgi:hypothetical protein
MHLRIDGHETDRRDDYMRASECRCKRRDVGVLGGPDVHTASCEGFVLFFVTGFLRGQGWSVFLVLQNKKSVR